MTFGPTSHDRPAAGFGSAAAADSQLDAPYRDRPANGFGDRGPAADGFGRPPAPLAAGNDSDAAYAPDSERFVTRAELDDHSERSMLVTQYANIIGARFDDMREAIDRTCDVLEVRKPKKSSLLTDMVNLAASAAIAGAAGVVAEIMAKRLSAKVMDGFDWLKQGHQRFANDAIKEHLKKSFHVGIATRYDASEVELARAFEGAQYLKFRAAKMAFFTTFGTETGDAMMHMPVPALRAAVQRATAGGKDGEIIAATEQQVAVEWANLVARVRHGAGGWDPWAGEHGSAHGLPTRDAVPPPDHASPSYTRPDADHASAGNVDPDSASVRDATDDDQRRMNPNLHGILEINLWGDGLVDDGDSVPGLHRHTRFHLYNRSGHGMRLGGVSDPVKRLITRFSEVRELKMNKVVTIFDDETLNPPKPVGRFLITADGYMRRSTTEGGEQEMRDAADFAQSLSPGLIK